jgi:hypothetical protein
MVMLGDRGGGEEAWWHADPVLRQMNPRLMCNILLTKPIFFIKMFLN